MCSVVKDLLCKEKEECVSNIHIEQAKQAHKVAQEQCQMDKQQFLFDSMKTWKSKKSSLDGFDSLKVDIISVHEQAARGVSQVESKYHER